MYSKDDTVILIATGQSMSQELADSVKGWDRIAVNNAFELCPDAVALVAQDKAWWHVHGKEVRKIFQGEKYTTHNLTGCKKVLHVKGMEKTSNSSSVLGLYLASQLGYKNVIMLGVDCWGTHYFGAHPHPLKNTKPKRFDAFKRQFKKALENLPNLHVVNCSENTKLDTVPISTLEKEGII